MNRWRCHNWIPRVGQCPNEWERSNAEQKGLKVFVPFASIEVPAFLPICDTCLACIAPRITREVEKRAPLLAVNS